MVDMIFKCDSYMVHKNPIWTLLRFFSILIHCLFISLSCSWGSTFYGIQLAVACYYMVNTWLIVESCLVLTRVFGSFYMVTRNRMRIFDFIKRIWIVWFLKPFSQLSNCVRLHIKLKILSWIRLRGNRKIDLTFSSLFWWSSEVTDSLWNILIIFDMFKKFSFGLSTWFLMVFL